MPNFRKRLNGSSAATARSSCLNSSSKKSSCTTSRRNSARRRATVVQYYSIKPLVPDCAVVLSALANVGSTTPAKSNGHLKLARLICARRMMAIWFCCRASNAAWVRLTPRSTAWRRLRRSSKKSDRSLRPHRRRGRRDSGGRSRTAPRHRRHAGLPDAAVCAGGLIIPLPAPRPIWTVA
jgi:hypothetical protein